MSTDEAQVDAIVALAREVVGRDALGAYLYGSAVLGGLKPTSDLDVLVVSGRATENSEKRHLIASLLAISGSHARSGPARSVELTIVVQSDVRPWQYPPRLDFQYGDWLRGEFERGELAPWTTPNPDLAVLITSVLLAAQPLFGPPATELLDRVPRDDLVRAMLDGIPELRADLDTDTRNVILTLVRIWTTVATGVIRTKDAAADWAIERLPEEHRPTLARARAMYLTGEERWGEPTSLVQALADRLVAEIREAARRAAEPRPATA